MITEINVIVCCMSINVMPLFRPFYQTLISVYETDDLYILSTPDFLYSLFVIYVDERRHIQCILKILSIYVCTFQSISV
jgi:hypothetical protein